MSEFIEYKEKLKKLDNTTSRTDDEIKTRIQEVNDYSKKFIDNHRKKLVDKDELDTNYENKYQTLTSITELEKTEIKRLFIQMIDDANQLYDEVEKITDELDIELKSNEQEINELLERNKEISDEIDEPALESLETLKLEIKDLEEHQKTLIKSKEDLELKIKNIDNPERLEKLNKLIPKLELELEKLKIVGEKLEVSKEKSNQAIENLENDIQKLTVEITSIKEAILTEEVEIKNLEEKIMQDSQKISELDNKINELSSKPKDKTSEAELKKLISQKQTLETNVNSNNSNLAKKRSNLESLNSTLDSKKQEESEKSKSLDLEKENNSNIELKLAKNKTQISDKKGYLKQRNIELEELEINDKEKIKSTLNDLNVKIKDIDNEKEKLKSKLDIDTKQLEGEDTEKLKLIEEKSNNLTKIEELGKVNLEIMDIKNEAQKSMQKNEKIHEATFLSLKRNGINFEAPTNYYPNYDEQEFDEVLDFTPAIDPKANLLNFLNSPKGDMAKSKNALDSLNDLINTGSKLSNEEKSALKNKIDSDSKALKIDSMDIFDEDEFKEAAKEIIGDKYSNEDLEDLYDRFHPENNKDSVIDRVNKLTENEIGILSSMLKEYHKPNSKFSKSTQKQIGFIESALRQGILKGKANDITSNPFLKAVQGFINRKNYNASALANIFKEYIYEKPAVIEAKAPRNTVREKLRGYVVDNIDLSRGNVPFKSQEKKENNKEER